MKEIQVMNQPFVTNSGVYISRIMAIVAHEESH